MKRNRNKLKSHEKEIIDKKMSGISTKDLAFEYDVPYSIMSQFLSRHGIKPANNIDDCVDKIIQEYKDGLSCTALAKKYHARFESIKKILVENNVEIRDLSHSRQIYSLNETYFDIIDNPNKAYILGLLYSDGNLNTSSGHYTMSISLQERDMNILNKIKDELEYGGPLHFYNLSSKNDNWQNSWKLSVNNKHIAESLLKCGVVPNKTFIIGFPKFLDVELIPHFLRGFWDGDGYISTKGIFVSCVSNKKFIFETKQIIEDVLGVKCGTCKTSSPSGEIYQLIISGKDNTIKFLNCIYKDADLYIERKYNYYIEKYCNNSQ